MSDTFIDKHTQAWIDEADHGHIWLWDSIDSEIGQWVCIKLRQLAQDDDTASVQLHINSPGGDLFPALAIVDMIRSLGKTVVTIGEGKVSSSALFVLVSGTIRLIRPHTRLLFHGVSFSYTGRSPNQCSEAEENSLLDKQICELMAKRTKQSVEFWADIINNSSDCWFDSEQALEWGVVDRVIK